MDKQLTPFDWQLSKIVSHFKLGRNLERGVYFCSLKKKSEVFLIKAISDPHITPNRNIATLLDNQARSTMYEEVHFISRNWRNSNVSCGSSPIKVHLFDYPKRFINRINQVYDFSIEYRRYFTVCFAAMALVIVLALFL